MFKNKVLEGDAPVGCVGSLVVPAAEQYSSAVAAVLIRYILVINKPVPRL